MVLLPARPGLTLDNLPVAEATAVRPPVEGVSGAQGRRRTMKGFRDAITEAGKAYPHLEVHWRRSTTAGSSTSATSASTPNSSATSAR